MSDPSRPSGWKPPPPPAPPLPAFQPRRAGVLQRLVETVGFGTTSRPPSRAQSRRSSYALTGAEAEAIHSFQPLPSQTIAHKTGIPIAALDANSDKTCAILAGKEILKVVRFGEGRIAEDANLRFNVSSTNTVSEDLARQRREYLPATDVKWSTGNFDNFIATAATHGRIALYDVNRADVGRAWVHEHTGQVNKLAFDPHIGALLLSGSHDGSVKMWDLRTLARPTQTMRSVRGFLSRKAGVRDVKWCPTQPTDALEFALCTDTGVIQKWDLRKPNQPLLSINAHAKSCLSIDWHPDGKHLVSGGLDKLIKVWDFHSDKGNQKAKFELRATQAIRNIKWRPPCWSSEFAGTGQWQCTQVATSYHLDDPRVHVWDLRRPHLPFRELERYRNPATDFLWATKDLIWTVGDEGWFTQTDVSYAPLVHYSIAPGTTTWFPDGKYSVFSENIGVRRGSGKGDPAVGFLSVPHEKLSSGEDMAISNSFSDEETGIEGILPNTLRRRQSKGTSVKTGKSQTNTPPTSDGFPVVLSLDKAVPEDMCKNNQVGMIGEVTGLSSDPDVVRYLADNYARPSSEAERSAQPGLILARLEAAFQQNAVVCEEISLHRTAQSWRILSAVLVPELKHWAENNRARRLRKAAELELAQHGKRANSHTDSLVTDALKNKVEEDKSEKIREKLFRGVVETERNVQDQDSSSNMTTPMARPLPDSPISDINSPNNRFQSLDETLEKLPQLPPSVLASHSTAAAAAKTLRESTNSTLSKQLSPSTPSTTSDSDTSPSKPKHRRAESSQSLRSLQDLAANQFTSQSHTVLASPIALRPTPKLPAPQRQEDRRAALREYQKQARPVLTFDEPPSSPAPLGGIPHQAFHTDQQLSSASTDQPPFLIFSTSDSSHETKQDGSPGAPGGSGDSRSYGKPGNQVNSTARSPRGTRKRRSSGDSRASQKDDRSGATTELYLPGAQTHDATNRTGCIEQERGAGDTYDAVADIGRRRRRAETARAKREEEAYEMAQAFGVDGASDGRGFGLDGTAWSREKLNTDSGDDDDGPKAWADWDEEDHAKYAKEIESRTSGSSSPHEPFEFDQESPVAQWTKPHARNYHINPFIRQEHQTSSNTDLDSSSSAMYDNAEEMASADFILYDFRPIDITCYTPPTPFAWSALPLITQSIAYDLETGPNCGQFSVHLLAHVHPFFFHQLYRGKPTHEVLSEAADYDVADRLMHPSLNSRFFEHIFMEHARYLKQLGMFVQMAELRKWCAEFDYPTLFTEDPAAVDAGLANSAPHSLTITCSNPTCRAPLLNGAFICQRCQTPRNVCPLCLAIHYHPESIQIPSIEENLSKTVNSNNGHGLWAYCHGCGHSAHLGCMDDWLTHPFSKGQCPTPNCEHDCGPGEIRTARILAAAEIAEEEKTVRPRKSVEGDKWKVTPSAAVERTRKSLRSVDDRGTQSGDDSGRMRSSFGSRGGGLSTKSRRGSLSGQGSQRKVRLVTPKEEIERSLSRD